MLPVHLPVPKSSTVQPIWSTTTVIDIYRKLCQKSIESIRTVQIITSYFLNFIACKCETFTLVNARVTRYVIIFLFILHLDNSCDMFLITNEILRIRNYSYRCSKKTWSVSETKQWKKLKMRVKSFQGQCLFKFEIYFFFRTVIFYPFHLELLKSESTFQSYFFLPSIDDLLAFHKWTTLAISKKRDNFVHSDAAEMRQNNFFDSSPLF